MRNYFKYHKGSFANFFAAGAWVYIASIYIDDGIGWALTYFGLALVWFILGLQGLKSENFWKGYDKKYE